MVSTPEAPSCPRQVGIDFTLEGLTAGAAAPRLQALTLWRSGAVIALSWRITAVVDAMPHWRALACTGDAVSAGDPVIVTGEIADGTQALDIRAPATSVRSLDPP
jgi:hypothetical protein